MMRNIYAEFYKTTDYRNQLEIESTLSRVNHGGGVRLR